MTTKRNLFTGAVIGVLGATALLTAGQKTRRHAQADWNAEQWLRLLSGLSETQSVRDYSAMATRKSTGGQPAASAELIGHTGYPLYR